MADDPNWRMYWCEPPGVVHELIWGQCRESMSFGWNLSCTGQRLYATTPGEMSPRFYPTCIVCVAYQDVT